MARVRPNEPAFKDGYEGVRPSPTLSGPERQQLRLVKEQVVDRLHRAMLTQCTIDGPDQLGITVGGIPQHIVEFSDLIGLEVTEAPPVRFSPSAADVDDMPKALALLDGLRRQFYTVVKLRALHEFAGEKGAFDWETIGDLFGLSPKWAEATYDAAIVQACRRAGLLPMVSMDFGVLVAAVWVPDSGWLAHISSAANPRAALANLRGKSPLPVEEAATIWVAGDPVAKRLVREVGGRARSLRAHHQWYKMHPETMKTEVIERARQISAVWLLEELAVKGPDADEIPSDEA